MGMIWDFYPTGGGELLTALSLADHAEHDGTSVYPSLKTLSEKTRQHRSTVKRHVKTMLDSGILILVRGESQHKAREYAFNLNMLTQQVQNAPSEIQQVQNAPGSNDRIQQVHSYEPRSVIDPSILLRAGFTNNIIFDEQAWDDWCEHRKEIKKKMTERAAIQCLRIIASFIQQGYTMRELIDWNIGQSNQGLYEPRNKKQSTTTKSTGKLHRALTTHLERVGNG